MTDHHDNEDTPSTELVAKVDWLRAQLEQVQETAQRAVETRKVGPLDEWVNVLRDYDTLAQAIARTEFVPEAFRGRPEAVTASMMFGREIGLPPLTMLQNTHVIKGKVGMYAEQLRAMILAAGHEYVIDESSSDRCVISARRKNSDRWQTHTYTMDQAKLAGLYAQNEQYRKRPVEMLLARASGIMAHAQFPDVIRGMSALEEIDVESPEAPPEVEPMKPTSTVQRRPRAKATGGKAEPPQLESEPRGFVVPDEPGLPPLPGEENPPSSVTDEPTRRTETEVASGRPGPTATTDAAPGEGSAGESTPGEGRRESTSSTPAESTAVPMTVTDSFLPEGRTERHCPDFGPHDEHAWADEEGAYACGGSIASTQVGKQEAGPLPEKAKPIAPADTRMLQARFRALGYTDEPDDREARLRVAAVLAGRDEVTTFRAGQKDSLTREDAQRILVGLADCRDRDDVLELMVRRAQDAAAEEESS